MTVCKNGQFGEYRGINWFAVLTMTMLAVFWFTVHITVKSCGHEEVEIEEIRVIVPLPQWFGSEEYEKARRLHQYHGTRCSWEDVVDGVEYFERGGEIVELWDPESR
jgi:hypothetical protein